MVCFGLKDGTDLSSKLKRAQVTPTLTPTLTLTLTLTTDPHPHPNPNPNPNQAAQAFGIKTIHFVPFEAGVLECAATYLTNYYDYTHRGLGPHAPLPRATRTTPLLTRYGVSGEAALSDVTLAATLKMQCEAHPNPDPNPNPNPNP